MAHIKAVLIVTLALTLCLLLWPAGRTLAKRLLRATLWASCAMTAGTGALIISDARGSLVALLGGALLLGFSAYAAVTAKSLGAKN